MRVESRVSRELQELRELMGIRNLVKKMYRMRSALRNLKRERMQEKRGKASKLVVGKGHSQKYCKQPPITNLTTDSKLVHKIAKIPYGYFSYWTPVGHWYEDGLV